MQAPHYAREHAGATLRARACRRHTTRESMQAPHYAREHAGATLRATLRARACRRHTTRERAGGARLLLRAREPAHCARVGVRQRQITKLKRPHLVGKESPAAASASARNFRHIPTFRPLVRHSARRRTWKKHKMEIDIGQKELNKLVSTQKIGGDVGWDIVETRSD